MKTGSDTSRRFGRATGALLIALAWLVSAYLFAHYSLLFYFGPNRLHAALRGDAYTALFPMGALSLFLSAALWLAAWLIPLLLAYFLIAACIRIAIGASERPLTGRLAILSALLVTGSLHFLSLDGWPTWVVPVLAADDTEFAADRPPAPRCATPSSRTAARLGFSIRRAAAGCTLVESRAAGS